MTTFDERERGFESKFAHDEEIEFKAQARRDRLLALWAGERMGLNGEPLQDYVTEVWRADLKHPGDADVFDKVAADLRAKGVEISDADLRGRMDALLLQARAEIAAG